MTGRPPLPEAVRSADAAASSSVRRRNRRTVAHPPTRLNRAGDERGESDARAGRRPTRGLRPPEGQR